MSEIGRRIEIAFERVAPRMAGLPFVNKAQTQRATPPQAGDALRADDAHARQCRDAVAQQVLDERPRREQHLELA